MLTPDIAVSSITLEIEDAHVSLVRRHSCGHTLLFCELVCTRDIHFLLRHEENELVRVSFHHFKCFHIDRMSRLTTYITLSVATAFLGAIFDLSQIYRRGYWNTTNGLDTSSVTIYMDFREVFFALSIALRYVSFWLFIAEPPRGELPLLPLPDDRRPNFISLESQTELHSSSWRRYSYLGPFIQWKMFVAIVAVLVLQLLWRLISKFHTFGPIYFVEEGLQIALSTVFILKLFANAIMSPLTPRWKTLRDYSPMVLAILLGLGVAIGNIACCRSHQSAKYLTDADFTSPSFSRVL